MTVEAQRPVGNPGTAPRGPAGPHPEPRGPKPSAPRPNTQKPPPSSPPPNNLAEALETLDLLARSMRVLATRGLPGADPSARMRLSFALELTLRTIADLQTPARRDPKTVATHGGPVDSGRGGKVAVSESWAASPRPVQATRVAAGSYCFCSALLVGHEYDPQYCKDSAPTECVARADRPMLPVRPTLNVEPEVADEDGVARGSSSGARFRAATHDPAGRPPLPGGASAPDCGEKWCCYERRRAGDPCPAESGGDFLLPRDVRIGGRP